MLTGVASVPAVETWAGTPPVWQRRGEAENPPLAAMPPVKAPAMAKVRAELVLEMMVVSLTTRLNVLVPGSYSMYVALSAEIQILSRVKIDMR